MYVIHDKSKNRAMFCNDEDRCYLLCNSKAHALRVIRWLGLTEVRVREATEEEVANGIVDAAKAKAHG